VFFSMWINKKPERHFRHYCRPLALRKDGYSLGVSVTFRYLRKTQPATRLCNAVFRNVILKIILQEWSDRSNAFSFLLTLIKSCYQWDDGTYQKDWEKLDIKAKFCCEILWGINKFGELPFVQIGIKYTNWRLHILCVKHEYPVCTGQWTECSCMRKTSFLKLFMG
jgi:hypothetical protein